MHKILFIIYCCISTALAFWVPPESFEDLVNSSELIVTAKVGRVHIEENNSYVLLEPIDVLYGINIPEIWLVIDVPKWDSPIDLGFYYDGKYICYYDGRKYYDGDGIVKYESNLEDVYYIIQEGKKYLFFFHFSRWPRPPSFGLLDKVEDFPRSFLPSNPSLDCVIARLEGDKIINWPFSIEGKVITDDNLQYPPLDFQEVKRQLMLTIDKQHKNALEMAKMGDQMAQYLMFYYSAMGVGMKRDLQQAYYWMNKTPYDPYLKAQMEEIRETPEGNEKAISYYKELADDNNLLAQYHLARAYYEGKMLPRDDRKSFEWLYSAALRELPAAQLKLSAYYAHGIGTKINLIHSWRWRLRAMKNDYLPALYMPYPAYELSSFKN